MSETPYPDYVQRMFAQAEAMITDPDYGPIEAAALCYEVLALFPDHAGAAALIHKALRAPSLIRDMRKSIGRHIDEWDDRPWQERRRLALSYRFLSRWESQDENYSLDKDEMWPADVRDMAEEGRHQLLQDYLLGQPRGAEVAWHIFTEAVRRTNDPGKMMFAVGYVYADQGYFAEAVEMLEGALAHNAAPGAAQTEIRRLLAEVRWWRDNQERIPWIPPAGDGSARRFQRMMTRLDPEFAQSETAVAPILEHIPPDLDNLPDDFALPPLLSPELTATIAAHLGSTPTETAVGPVDWQYLDRLERGEVDITQLPEWAQYLLLELDNPEQEMAVLQYVLSLLANPDEEE